MSVYVDKCQQWPTPMGRRLGPTCHMWADDPEELDKIALQIGLKRSWLQDKDFVHYDLTQSRRRKAVNAGAIEADSYYLVYWRHTRKNGHVPMAHIQWRKIGRKRRSELTYSAMSLSRKRGQV